MTNEASPEMEVHLVEEKHQQVRDEDVCVDNAQKINFNYELSSDFSWSDDGSGRGGFCLSDIHDSVAAIREEASTLDAILAMDQISTLRTDIASLQRELASKNEELDELRELVIVKDVRICTLELECDLYKADFCNQIEHKETMSTTTTFESNPDRDQLSTESSEEPKPSADKHAPDLPVDETPST